MKSAKVHYIHSLSYSARDKLAGTFVLIALLLIFGLFASRVNVSTIFAPVINYQAVMKNAQGITVETVIIISGLDVGRVDDIYLGDNNEVNIHFFIYKRFQSLVRTDSIGEVGRQSLVGDNVITIKAGSPKLPMLPENATIQIREPDFLALTEITPVVKKFTSMITRLSQVLDAIDPQVIRDSSQDLQIVMADLRKISNQVSRGKGSLGRALYDKDQEQSVANSLLLIEKTLTKIAQRIDEFQPIIANANHLAIESKKIVASAAQLNSESLQLIIDVRRSVNKVDQQLIHLPTIINSTQSVLQSTEHALNGQQPVHILIDNNIWPFSSGTSAE